jgi:hypothetical protein
MSVSFGPRSRICFTFTSRVCAFANTADGSCCAGLRCDTFSATAALR